MSLDLALETELRPDKSFNFPSPCPHHPEGDEARLDYLAKGWTADKCAHCGKRAVWKTSFLCDALFVEYWCDRHLPATLRRLL